MAILARPNLEIEFGFKGKLFFFLHFINIKCLQVYKQFFDFKAMLGKAFFSAKIYLKLNKGIYMFLNFFYFILLILNVFCTKSLFRKKAMFF